MKNSPFNINERYVLSKKENRIYLPFDAISKIAKKQFFLLCFETCIAPQGAIAKLVECEIKVHSTKCGRKKGYVPLKFSSIQVTYSYPVHIEIC